MERKKIAGLQSLLFAGLGIFLLYLSFRKTNFEEVGSILKNGNYWVALPVLVVSFWVYFARVKRWQILYLSIGKKASPVYLFASLAMGYLINFAVPRLGEISRALILKKELNFPVKDSLSTIVFERLVDMLCLFLILATAFSLEFVFSGNILQHFTSGINVISPFKLTVLVLIGVAFWVLSRWLKPRKDEISNWINGLIQTTFELLKMKQKGWFVFYTLSIWLGFYLMTYLWFFIFPESQKLSHYQAFLVMTLGVIARTLPIQAGSAGAYHFVVSQALFLMGVSLATGNALAIVIHGFQTILTILFGSGAYLWLVFKNRTQPKSLYAEKTTHEAQ